MSRPHLDLQLTRPAAAAAAASLRKLAASREPEPVTAASLPPAAAANQRLVLPPPTRGQELPDLGLASADRGGGGVGCGLALGAPVVRESPSRGLFFIVSSEKGILGPTCKHTSLLLSL
jgi:hypothetical protein